MDEGTEEASDEGADGGIDDPESGPGRKARIVAAVVLLVAMVTAVVQTVDRGGAGAVEGLLFVFIAAVLAYGVFRDVLEAPPIQVAFGVGIGAYGLLQYGGGGSPIWLGLALVAALLVARNAAYMTA